MEEEEWGKGRGAAADEESREYRWKTERHGKDGGISLIPIELRTRSFKAVETPVEHGC